MADIFQEVDEEVRREQLKKLWDRYGYLLIAGCVLIVLAVASWRGYQYWQARQAARSGAAFEQALTLAEAGKHKEAEAAFDQIAKTGSAGYRILSRLRGAAELAQSDRAAAIKAYEAIAADRSLGQELRDLATIRAGILRVDTASYSQMRAALEPLAQSSTTFRHSARELLALSAWKSGDTASARKWAEALMTDPETPAGARGRAEILTELIAANGKG